MARAQRLAGFLGLMLVACNGMQAVEVPGAGAGREAVREAELCAGVATEDRELGPFRNVESIASVRVLRSARYSPRGFRGSRPAGALVVLRPVEGMTVESLQRVIDCHLAHDAALGHVAGALPDCPLVPRGVRARVSTAREGLAVVIRARNPRSAREVAVRARRLAAASAPLPER